MSIATSTEPQIRRGGVPWWARRRLILIVSLWVVPLALNVALNSYGPLTAESALRMAFATVAGQTIAIIGAVAALVVTITHRRPLAGIVFFGLVLMFVVAYALTAMEGAGVTILERLDLIAEVDQLN
ncbi:hypothetical protein [Microbacterium sp. SA39]|uniref:hypothetical protein n=1 Tax=Microbacterium sp. SA39 TaxID=1263625 RepID=UPI0005FA0B47|nr:hypothetical protein [Microbacterium sp. SA39]KJQ53209.1 hypothetical protein RS85_03290 [Microbacterium sp. SA39]